MNNRFRQLGNLKRGHKTPLLQKKTKKYKVWVKVDITIFFTALPCNTETHNFFFMKECCHGFLKVYMYTKCTQSVHVVRIFALFVGCSFYL